MLSSDPASQPYGLADRILHRIALSRLVMELSFDMERNRFGTAARARKPRAPVFVCGLARAGTTLIMRILYASGVFASLSYRDLPFPLAPNFWSRAGKGLRREIAATERGHGDGVLHDLDTPEAIEEVFWRCFEGRSYIRPEGLVPAEPLPETLGSFVDYVALVARRYDRGRYLSKNNNNILRLSGLVSAFPDAVLVHPFRDPAEQALSLLNQHRRASALAERTPFRRVFMAMLGHHEFGGDHRPFLVGVTAARFSHPGMADYWLKQWTEVYRHLLDQPQSVRERQRFVSYDDLVRDPARSVTNLAAVAGLAAVDPESMPRLAAPAAHASAEMDLKLLDEARGIHAELRSRALSLEAVRSDCR